ncbi:hypothetical protein C1280_27360 [Gemmata obscuriglobus]|uniref:Uncharacterized protein n=2 Tax=Gemmata obscuriglobus TaxID=114 RepID=A0A2Z3H2V9_9BACT|nr:hypothetical protein C1280_27360 [Gemmata obscuriglobus]
MARLVGGAVCVWLVVGTAAPAAADDSAKLLAEVRAAWQQRQDAARTARFVWTGRTVHPKGVVVGTKGPGKDVVNDGTGRVLLEGNKWRLATRGLIWSEPPYGFVPEHREVAFDGERYVTLIHHQPGHNQFPYGLIRRKPGEVAQASMTFNLIDYWPLRVAVRGADPRLSNETLETHALARRATLQGRPVVELVQQRTEVSGESKVWVDPAQDYAVRRHDMYTAAGELHTRIDVTTERHPSGVWLPKAWTVQSMSGAALQRRTVFTLVEVTLNPSVAAGDLEIDFPPNTVVDEYTDSKGQSQLTASHIVRGDGGRRPIVPGEWNNVGYEDLLRTEPGELLGSVPPPWWTSRSVLVAACGVVLALAVAALLVVRRRALRRRTLPVTAEPPVNPRSEER